MHTMNNAEANVAYILSTSYNKGIYATTIVQCAGK